MRLRYALELLRLEDHVAHLGQVLAGDTELPRRAAPAEGEHHVGGAHGALRGHEVPHAVGVLRHALDGHAGHDGHLRLLDDAVPQRDELFFAHLAALDRADERELERAGHDDLGARVVHDRAADLVALDEEHAHAALEELERRAHAGGTGADHDGVVGVAGAAPTALHRVRRRLPTLADRVADQAHAAELADDVHAGARGLEVRVEARQLHAAGGGAVDERDRLHRARLHARRVADARERVQQLGLAVDHADDLVLRAREHARARPDAPHRVDHRVDGVGDDLAERRPCPRASARASASCFLPPRPMSQYPSDGDRRSLPPSATSHRRFHVGDLSMHGPRGDQRPRSALRHG